MEYFAPATRIPLSDTDGPPAPLGLVVVRRLNEPEYAAALVATGVLAPLNELQPSAVASSKLYEATVCAREVAAQNTARRAVKIVITTFRREIINCN